MYYCIAYDIRCNRLRRRVVKWCKQAGLRRMQRSVFAGRVPAPLLRELKTQVTAELPDHDRFCIIPLDKNAVNNIVLLGDDEVQTLLEQPIAHLYF
jgi:CRISPR-associated protein Cas2